MTAEDIQSLPHEDLINTIMDHFDFDKVHRAMVALDWRWSNDDGVLRVPEQSELRQEARRLLRDTVGHDSLATSCGGLRASIEHGVLGLSFEIDEVAVSTDGVLFP